MQPLATTCIRRPFHWGIVIIADAESGSQIPDLDPEKAVSSNEHGIVALIRCPVGPVRRIVGRRGRTIGSPVPATRRWTSAGRPHVPRA
jgi:hypothetical protein